MKFDAFPPTTTIKNWDVVDHIGFCWVHAQLPGKRLQKFTVTVTASKDHVGHILHVKLNIIAVVVSGSLTKVEPLVRSSDLRTCERCSLADEPSSTRPEGVITECGRLARKRKNGHRALLSPILGPIRRRQLTEKRSYLKKRKIVLIVLVVTKYFDDFRWFLVGDSDHLTSSAEVPA